MRPSDALLDLDLGLVSRLRPRSGLTETLSLTASYDFGFDEYISAGPGSRPARTVLHETMHAYQMLATSYGHYYLSLRALQTSRVLTIIDLLRQAGQPLQPPLIRQILSGRPESAWAQLRLELYVWYLAEMVLLFLEGDADRFSNQVLNNPAFRGRGLTDLFHDLEGYLVQWCRSRGHDVTAGPPAWDESRVNETLLQYTLKLTGPEWGDTHSVLESGARVAEDWRTWRASLAEFDASLSDTYTVYNTWIKQARRADLAPDPMSFALTYSTLVDLALNPPLLPHHAGLRGTNRPPSDLSPAERLWRGLGVSGVGRGEVPPIRDLARDHERFVDEVCARNGWPTPTTLAASALDSLPGDEEPVEPMTALYRLAQRFRLRVPYAFVDLDIWSIDGPTARLFREAFVHPVIQFSDCVLYHRDKQMVAGFVLNYAQNQYLRQLMVVGNQPVTLPFRAMPEELEIYTGLLSEALGEEVGLRRPRVRLVAAPATAHRPGSPEPS